MEKLTPFLLSAIIISLSGVMAPGAVTAATIAQGTRSRWAGLLISVGHGIVEMPLIFLLMLGLHFFFEMDPVKIAIGRHAAASPQAYQRTERHFQVRLDCHRHPAVSDESLFPTLVGHGRWGPANWA
ncbi:MAG: LysE family transporter [Planctomycetota bacterium]|jgi:hypothetical protein